MNIRDKRRLKDVAHALAQHGVTEQNLSTLCAMADCAMPEIRGDEQRRHAMGKLVHHMLTTGFQAAPRVLAQPKPQKRIIDPKAIAEYVRTHDACEIVSCARKPCPEPHHLVSRKMKGSDIPSNLIRVCVWHHREWHEHGGNTWLQKYGHNLTADTRSKVATALRLTDDSVGALSGGGARE